MTIPPLDKIKVVVAAHVTEIYGPVQALRNYLENEKYSFLYITHPLRECLITDTLLENFDRGNLINKKIVKRRKRRLISFMRDLFFDIFLVFRYRREKKIFFIGIDNINAFGGIVLRKLGVVEKVVYYVIDYTPRRFGNVMLNYLYHYLDRFCARHADCIWNISSRIATLREKQRVKKEKNMIVPVGVEVEEIKADIFSNIAPNRLIFVSYLSVDKGCQLAVEAMAEIVRYRDNVAMEIIGTGPYEEELRKLVNKYGLNNKVKFSGYMTQEKLVKNLWQGGIALAPYLDDQSNITYYADPTKVKIYLACGLPVIITKVPWIAEEIERLEMGIAVEYNKEQLVAAALKMLRDVNFYNKCRTNALKYASGLKWEEIYNKAFARLN